MGKLLLLLSVLVSGSAEAATRTVDHVDLNRYKGDWYEIASIPQKFSKGCHCTRARYGVNQDGTVSVVNTCNKDSTRGKLSVANGKAKVVDTSSNAKLKVTFFWPFYGDYWIIGLDSQYRYAVVSNEEGTTLWILSRTPVLEKNLLNEALRIAQNNDVDTTQLEYMAQAGCRYPK